MMIEKQLDEFEKALDEIPILALAAHGRDPFHAANRGFIAGMNCKTIGPGSLTVQNIEDQKQLLQDDITCILDGLDDEIIDNVCQAVVERMNLLMQKGHE